MTTDLHILLGQSNAGGRATVAQITGDNYKTSQSNSLMLNLTKSLVEYNPNTNSSPLELPGNFDYFGLENSLMKELYDYDNRGQRLLKFSRGGTGLYDVEADNWNIGTNASYNLYIKAKRFIKYIINEECNSRNDIILRGIYWFQGEQDATNETYANAYASNLSNFMSGLINLINDYDGIIDLNHYKVICGKVQSGTYKSTVNTALSNWCASNDGIFVDTDSIPLQGDGVHYTADGLIILGNNIYNQIKIL